MFFDFFSEFLITSRQLNIFCHAFSPFFAVIGALKMMRVRLTIMATQTLEDLVCFLETTGHYSNVSFFQSLIQNHQYIIGP